MLKIEKKEGWNYIIFALKGHISNTEYIEGTRKLINIAEKIEGKFGVVTDLSEWDSYDPESAAGVESVMKQLIERGMVIVARVISTATAETLQVFQKSNVKAGYFTRYFSTLAEAESYIQEKLKNLEMK
jgi:hypothetical protein